MSPDNDQTTPPKFTHASACWIGVTDEEQQINISITGDECCSLTDHGWTPELLATAPSVARALSRLAVNTNDCNGSTS